MKIFRGGLTSYEKAGKDISLWMKQDNNEDAYFTTMFDLYKLPGDFPGYEDSLKHSDPLARIKSLEESFGEDINHPRFIPYIQLHEFEALLFTDPTKLSVYFFDKQKQIENLQAIWGKSTKFPTPEHIDDGETTAPSKRIGKEIPAYLSLKVIAAPMVAKEIGLSAMRGKCAHFNEWIIKLECLGGRNLKLL